jgi:hypothetical protein
VGRLVNVVLPSGKVVAVDEDVARASKLAAPSVTQEAAPLTQQLNEERTSGVAEGAKALGEGLADTLTGGLAGGIHGALDQDYRRNAAIRGQERSGSRFAGELAGFALPGLGEAGALGKAGEAFEFTAPGLASKAGEAVTEGIARAGTAPLTRGMDFAAKVAGRATEGAIIGASGRIADTNVSGDPLTIESILEDAGVGSLMNVGQGALTDRMFGSVTKARGKLAEVADEENRVAQIRESASLAAKGKEIFSKDSPATAAWDEFTEKAKQGRQQALQVKQAAEQQAKAYAEWTSPTTAPKKLRGAIDQLESARNEVLTRINQTEYGKAVGASADEYAAARDKYIADTEKATTLLSSTEKWPAVLQKVDSAIDTVYGRYTLPDVPRTYKPKILGYEGELDAETGQFVQKKAIRTATEKPAISPELDADLQQFAQRRSMITKMKDGGYRIDGGHWVADPSVPPDPLGALQELHKLRDDFTGVLGRGEMRDFHSVKFPDLPDVPRMPSGMKVPDLLGDQTELASLSSAARDLSDTAARARKLLRDGRFSDAAEEVRAARKKAQFAGLHDLELPNLPPVPQPIPVVPDEISLPDNLRAFARQKPETIANLVNQLDEPSREAFQKVYSELQLTGARDATEAITATHRELGRYIQAFDRIDAETAKAAVEGEQGGRFLSWLRKQIRSSAQYSAARSVDSALGHGWTGAVGRVFAGQTAGVLMGGIENAVLGRDDFSAIGGLMAVGREGLRMKVARLVEKYGERVATAGERLRPLTTHLATSFLTGAKDPETDPRKQALNRVNEINGLNLTARDTMFAAVEPLMGHPSDVAWKLHASVIGALQHLSVTAPRDPGVNVKLGKSAWTPSHRDALTLAARIEAVKDPLTSIDRILSGGGNAAAAETLWAVYPAMMQQVQAELLMASQGQNLSMQQASQFSRLFRVPLTGFQQPQVVTAIQGMYMQRLAQQVASGQQAATPNFGSPGRPPKVRNRVAGSSVAGLISQQ